ncbi:MAG: hypothetical protein EYC70_12495 [Planctomycetota bacterium]|nr:MAG: hypothetical protein EYC70_12495 [Planctomycetota bacterium]
MLAPFLSCLLSLAPAQLPGPTLFGSDVAANELGEIDRATAAWTTIGPQGVGFAINGLAYDPRNDRLYGIAPNDQRLYLLDMDTGAATPIGASGATGFANANALAYDALNSLMYSADLNTNTLFRVDPATSTGIPVGVIQGAADIEGLGYDPERNLLYGLDDRDDRIVRIHPRFVTTAHVVDLPQGFLWRGLDYDTEQNVLWATTVNPGGLYRVDPLVPSVTFVGVPRGFVQGVSFADRPGLRLEAGPLVAGAPGMLRCSNGNSGDPIRFVGSLTGGGPTLTQRFGAVWLTLPFLELGTVPTDAGGVASLGGPIPASLSGSPVWFQAGGMVSGQFERSNGLAAMIL